MYIYICVCVCVCVCIHTPHFPYPFTYWWTLRLFPYLLLFHLKWACLTWGEWHLPQNLDVASLLSFWLGSILLTGSCLHIFSFSLFSWLFMSMLPFPSGRKYSCYMVNFPVSSPVLGEACSAFLWNKAFHVLCVQEIIVPDTWVHLTWLSHHCFCKEAPWFSRNWDF